MVNSIVKKGTCPECIEKQKTLPDYCCLFCSLGLKKGEQKVDKYGTVHVNIVDLFPGWGKK